MGLKNESINEQMNVSKNTTQMMVNANLTGLGKGLTPLLDVRIDSPSSFGSRSPSLQMKSLLARRKLSGCE